MKYKVFIDGLEGTTGLKILDRFNGRDDVELLRIDEDKRKDTNERKKLINASDFTFLCLPDAAAIEAVSLVENENVKIIDASTAHRTEESFVYGLPELSKEQREKIASSKRVAVPGCYASGFVSIVYPLIKSGILSNSELVSCFGISGYSGGGKKMIAQYEAEVRDEILSAPRQYALTQQHKHLKEMQKITGLSDTPIFCPIVSDYYSGMAVSVPVFAKTLLKKMTANEVCEFYKDYYKDEHFINVQPFLGEGVLTDGFLSANAMSNKNGMQIFVCGNDDRIVITSRFDNLLKGASGAAVQCMNIMMGIDEKTSLM